MRRSDPGILLLIFLAGVTESGAQIHSSPAADPTEFGSPRLDPSEAVELEPAEWSTLVTTSYFNQWNGTWHTRRIRLDSGRIREPIGDDELLELEKTYPQDEIYRLDLEGWRADLFFARGFPRGITAAVRIPWITIGTPHGDGMAEAFHSVVPVDAHYARDLFARDQTFLYFRNAEYRLLRRDDLDGSFVGDISLSIGIPVRQQSRMRQRLVLMVEAPTGDQDSLAGSGGWDAGIRWFGRTRTGKTDWLLGAGYTWLDPSGSFLGIERSSTWHLSADLTRPLSRRTSAHLAARLDSSPWLGATNENLAEPVLFYRLGLQWTLPRNQWISFDLAEEIAPQMGVDADFGVQLAWGWRSAGTK
ncbi:MAG TPA: DUF3187 family protein [Thermoanaerobaculia bacterium]|nr:DUF3187 family protein [Thermoanaerobaculia bacterium]